MDALHKTYGVVVLLVLDFAWVRGVMMGQYFELVKKVQEGRDMKVRTLPVVLAYVLMVVGLLCFVLDAERSAVATIGRGAMFGVVVYGVYNGTAAAVFDKWSPTIAALDVAWGATVYAVAAAAARLL